MNIFSSVSILILVDIGLVHAIKVMGDKLNVKVSILILVDIGLVRSSNPYYS